VNLEFVSAGGLRLAVWEWPGAGPPLLFAHATGFHGRMWDHIIRQFPGRRALAIEFRGHGRSAKPAPPIPWRSFAEDILAVVEQFDLRGVVGVGHSMGGHALAEAAALHPDAFAALVLADPVIFPPHFYGAPGPDVSFILRRRNRWTSPAEMFERFRPRLPFAAWPEEVVRNYCDYALLPDGDGYVLACPPEVEASIYRESQTPEADIAAALATLRQPVTIVRAGRTWQPGVFDPSASPTAPDIAARFANAKEVFLAENNHFIPMEAPHVMVREIRAVLGRTLDTGAAR
jgi:pimeloyl-ACP methyl ester carboxylesterase